jgi:hypothetical protein
MVKGIYERVPSDSGPLNFLVEIHAFEYLQENLDSGVEVTYLSAYPSGFITRISVMTFKRADSKDTITPPDTGWCDFHEHRTKEDEVACQSKSSRQQDLDMVHQARKIARANAGASVKEQEEKKRKHARRANARGNDRRKGI